MKKVILALVLCLGFSSSLFAQTTATTATVTDSDSTVWTSAQWSVAFVPNPNFPNQNQYSIAGVSLTSNTYKSFLLQNGTANTSGVISVTLLDNNLIQPAGSKWSFIIQSNTSASATSYAPVAVSGGSTSLSSYLSTNAVAPRFPAITGAFGYADLEVSTIPEPGGGYYNTGTITPGGRVWSGTAWGNSGGGATLPSAAVAGQTLVSTGPGTTYTAQNATRNIELSCASDIGAQFNAAVTTLSGHGRIIFPNCLTATMSTTASYGQGISIGGYGPLGSKIQCTVAGKCLSYTGNPTTQGEIGGVVSDFEIDGNGASGQILMSNSGMSGYTLHDIQFEPYAGTGNQAQCLIFSNDTTGQFTEGMVTYNIYLERQCNGLGNVIFFQNVAGDTSNSHGYNIWSFHVVVTGPTYGVVGTSSQVGGISTSFLYNGSLTVIGNYTGAAGGIVEFLNGFSTDNTIGRANERIYVAAENNGGTTGTLINIPASGSLLNFYGDIINGAFNSSGTSLATTLNDPSQAFNLWSDIQVANTGNFNSPLNMNHYGTLTLLPNLASTVNGNLVLTPFGTTTPTWTMSPSNGANQLYFTQSGFNPVAGFPLVLYGAPFAGANALRGMVIPSDACWQFESTATGATVDTSFCRLASGVLQVGTPTSLQSGLLLTGDTCRVTAAITLSTSATNVCSWSLPAVAQSWGFVCHIPYAISAGTLPTFALGMNASQAPTNETAYASINSTNTNTGTQGSATSASSGAVAILTGASVTVGSTYQAQVFGTIQASAIAGTFAITATLAGTTPAGTIPIGASCTLQ